MQPTASLNETPITIRNLNGQEHVDEVFCFARAIKNHELGFSYFPKKTGNFETTCITINSIPVQERVIFTFYTDKIYFGVWNRDTVPHELISGNDSSHLARFHKIKNSLDSHYHVSVKHSNCDKFFKTTLERIGFESKDVDNIESSANQFISDSKLEKIEFNDGSYSENVTADFLDETTASTDDSCLIS